MKRAAWTSLLLLLFAAGCTPSDEQASERPFSGRQASEWTLADLHPDAVPYKKTSLTLKGTPLEGELLVKSQGPQQRIQVLLRGQVLEEEVYRSTTTEFSYCGGSFETFEPPIPLLRANNRVPSRTTWEGSLLLAKQRFRAEAAVTTSTESLNIPGGPYQTVKTLVSLAIDTGLPKRAERTLTFWFAPGRGIVQRQIDDSSLRGPYAPVTEEDTSP